MFLIKPAQLWCTLLSAIVASALPTPSNGLNTFTIIPATAPALAIPAGTPLQFNGSYPAEGSIPGQLGWWIPPVTGNTPIDLVSFVQYNKDAGIVFWARATAFELFVTSPPFIIVFRDSCSMIIHRYLEEVITKTYAVKLGQPLNETPKPGLAGNWTVSPIPGYEKAGFGWKGDYKSWFVCKEGNGYYALYLYVIIGEFLGEVILFTNGVAATVVRCLRGVKTIL